METAKVALYDIKKCGYYPRGRFVKDFGDVQTMMEDLSAWVQGKDLSQTRLNIRKKLGVFVADARGDGNRFLVTLWNEVPATDGQVASIRSNSGVGRPDVVMNGIEQGTIPGFATYFYFMPDRNLVAGVRFQHASYGQLSMCYYMRDFLRYAGRHVVLERGDDDVVHLVGTVENPGDEPKYRKPIFETVPSAREGKLDLLARHAGQISKVVRKASLDATREVDLSLWQLALDRISARPRPRGPDPIRIRYELDVQLTEPDVRDIIQGWRDENGEEWDDVGFVLRGSANDIEWLSHSSARGEISVDVRRDSPEVVNPASLLREMIRMEPTVIGLGT